MIVRSVVGMTVYRAASQYKGAGKSALHPALYYITELPFYLPLFASGLILAHFAVTKQGWVFEWRTHVLCRPGVITIGVVAFVVLKAVQYLSLRAEPLPNSLRVYVVSVLAFYLLLLALFDPVVARLFFVARVDVYRRDLQQCLLTHAPILQAIADMGIRTG